MQVIHGSKAQKGVADIGHSCLLHEEVMATCNGSEQDVVLIRDPKEPDRPHTPDWTIKIPTNKSFLSEHLKDKNVKLIVENNFTFAVAFAAWRKSVFPWIPPIMVAKNSDYHVCPTFDSVRLDCIQNVYSWHDRAAADLKKKVKELHLSGDFSEPVYKQQLMKIRALSELPDQKRDIWSINQLYIDPCPQYSVVWLQCPSSGADKSLLRDALSWTEEGGMVCVGMYKDYLCSAVWNAYTGYDKTIGCNFCGVDTAVVPDVLSYGYQPYVGDKPAHVSLLQHLITLYFKK